MAKRKRQSDEATMKRRLEEGRGTGRGRDYKPWLRVQDVPSQGLASRVKGITTNREHHVLSNLEYHCLLLLDWAECIVDIREQYPLLPIEETLAMAEEIGIRHPADPRSKTPFVMTTDFLVTVKRGSETFEEAIAVKSSNELASKRVLEKLELERRYWEKRNTFWQIVTEREIPATTVENLEWIRPYHSVQDLSPLTGEDVDRIRFTLERYLSGTEVLSTVTRRIDDRLGLVPGTSLSVTRYLLASRLWRADISLPMGPEHPLHLLEGLQSLSGVIAS